MPKDDPRRDAVARAICAERCAHMGEPPCFDAVFADEPWPNPNCDDPGCHALADAALSAINGSVSDAE